MNKISKYSIILILAILAATRLFNFNFQSRPISNIFTWDSFGYYMILPGMFIYKDWKKFEWVEGINEQYKVSNTLYQVSSLPNGNRVMKYLLGVSILYSPFFAMGHAYAVLTGGNADGFSIPYEVSISIAALFYAFVGLWFLRKVLLKYFDEITTSVTLVLLALSTNYIQYVSIDCGQSHGYVFALYAMLLFFTIKWHEKPSLTGAFFIGAVIGLGIISRPTEAVMVLIPLLYGMQDQPSRQSKWRLVKEKSSHVILTCLGGFIGIFPQLIYWKMVTGNWVYDVGSKFTFFNPHWRVLFGWEKGWFIYTPIVLLMLIGLFLIRKNPFSRSIWVYFTLNTWILIAWSIWRYGASYSCRALVQSYAVMAIPFAAAVKGILDSRFKIVGIALLSLSIPLNLFQIWQYNKGILHYDHMNRRYYGAIFLNSYPTPLQMSLLDTKEYIRNEESFNILNTFRADSQFVINAGSIPSVLLWKQPIRELPGIDQKGDVWLRISSEVLSSWGAYDTDLITSLEDSIVLKETRCRMQHALCKHMEWNSIAYFFKIPADQKEGIVTVKAETKAQQNIFIRNFEVRVLQEER